MTNGRDYIYIDQQLLKWTDAQNYCRLNVGSDLATIITQDDYINALNAIPNDQDKAWIGLNDIDMNNDWTWSDGTNCSLSDGQCTTFWSINIDFGRCVVLHTNNTDAFQSQGFMAIECNFQTVPFLCNSVDTIITPTTTEQLTTIIDTKPPTSLTDAPTLQPTIATNAPTVQTDSPTMDTTAPSLSPSKVPTEIPTMTPTKAPTTSQPTLSPTIHTYTFNEDYIYTTEPKLTFQKAQQFCKNKFGTSLATILNEQDIESIMSLIPIDNNDNRFWIGLFSTHEIGWWIWFDGTKCVKPAYGACSEGDFWRDGHPKCLKKNENGYNCTNFGKMDNKFDNGWECQRSESFLCNTLNKEHSNNNALVDIIFSDKFNDNNDNYYHGLDRSTIFRIIVLCFISLIIFVSFVIVSCKKLISYTRRYREKYKSVSIGYCDGSDDTSDELDEILADSM